MSYQATAHYLQAILPKYQVSSKKDKSLILNHAEMATKLSRKHLIKRLSNNVISLKKEGSGRPLTYNKSELLPHIKHIWMCMEQITSKRMKAGLDEWLLFYPECPGYLKLQLNKMSSSTLERYLKEIRQELKTTKGISTTCPAKYMKNKVPINTLDSQITSPGFTQTDTVAHCGDSAKGPFISSLTVTDIFTTWTENRAVFTKKGHLISKNFRDVERVLPFKLLAINSDSGSEFLNKEMLKYTNYGHRVKFTRSRPYKKNDNCYVEQKNYTHVRQLFGYERLEDDFLVEPMNDIYKTWNDLQNYFIPTFKLKEKIRVGARIQKKYDTPKTPYARAVESSSLNKYEKSQLKLKKEALNPFKLKLDLEAKLKDFYELIRTTKRRKVA